MSIYSIDKAFGKSSAGLSSKEIFDKGEIQEPSFSTFLERHIDSVNELLADSDKKSTEVAVGKSENLHEAMISFEKAESALKLLMQVRNKALEAYNEVLRMPL